MTSRDFCYWLQGFFEIHESAQQSYPPSLDPSQTDMVKRHLAMVFTHEIDPSMGPPEHQKVLNEIHQAAAAEQIKTHMVGCILDINHAGKCSNKRPQIGGTGPDGTVYRC